MKKKKMLLLLLIVTMLFMGYNKVFAFSNYSTSTKSCGGGFITNIPATLPRVVHIFYLLLQVAVPVILVIFGMIDLIKAISSGKEDDIKRNQGVLVRRLITGVLIFFIFSFVKLLINVVADDDKQANKIMKCADCFLNNNSSCNKKSNKKVNKKVK